VLEEGENEVFRMKRVLQLLTGYMTVICFALPAVVFGAAAQDVLKRPALKVKDPVRTVLIDVTHAGNRLVAVGERGVIIFSDDAGDTWQQADVPVSATLTAVDFPTPDKGWAVGHSGVVLHTSDGGKSWRLQLDGIAAARMALETARAAAARLQPEDSDAIRLVKNAELLVADGSDKPFLDLNFESEGKGVIIGAYGLIFTTTDGGQSWQCMMDRVENPMGLHLYAIRASGDNLYIAGEQGLFLVSRDMGHSYQQAQTPYSGTFFDLAVTSTGNVVIVGLRGNAYWSANPVDTFNPTEVPVPVSFTASGQLGNGVLIFANQAGMLLESRDQGRTMQVIDVQRMAPISSFIPINDGNLLTVGYGGVNRIQLPSPDSEASGGQQ
jgi:photosystem II stability/assembly factor-like uncharacterized protein